MEQIEMDCKQTVNSKVRIENFMTQMNSFCDLSPYDIEN